MILILLLTVILASAFSIRPAKSQTIHWGSGVAYESEYFNFGTGDIFWSIASEERGYFYGSSFSTPTVYFADKIENYWGSRDSYQGVQNIWEFTDASNHEWFTQHSITFAEETSPYYTEILLIHQGDLYGAIKPKSIHNGDLNHPEDYVLEYDWWYDDSGSSDFSSLEPPPTELEAIIDVSPKTLNLKSNGKWVTAYIELPENYNVGDINRTTVLLNDTIPVDSFWMKKPLKSAVGDHDKDDISDLMVRFDRTEVEELIFNASLPDHRFFYVMLTITGLLTDETHFEGNHAIRAILPYHKHSSKCRFMPI